MNANDLRVLVVEDQSADFLLLQRQLATRGIDAACRRIASNEELTEALLSPWDLVICDMVVPGMDSGDTVRALRDHDPTLPVILFSAHVGEEAAVEHLRLGAWDFVSKDNPARLRLAIERALNDAATRRAWKAAEGRLRMWADAFERAGFALAVSRIDCGQFDAVNPAFCRLLGYDAAELVGEPIERVYPADRLGDLERIRTLLAERGHAVLETDHVTRDGRRFPVLLDISVARAGDGLPGMSVVYARDISERRQVEAELRVAAAAFESQEGMIVTGADTRIQRVNSAFTRITGYAEHECVGRTPKFLQSGQHDRHFYARMWDALARDGIWQGELINRHRNGSLFTERLTISAVRDVEGRVTHYVGTLSDITREREAQARAEHLTHFDPLTDLPNRSLLQDRLGHAMAESARSGQRGAVLLLDLDHFRNLNDSLGHRLGDELLLRVAKSLRDAVRECDTIARFGGDTFAVVMDGLATEDLAAAQRAAAVAQKLRQAVAASCVDHRGRVISCTASIGLALFEGPDEGVLKSAETAMYRAKASGRDRVILFEPRMQAELEARNAIESDLRAALGAGEFEPYYQVQVGRDDQPIGAEVLLRWNHPTRGLVLPGDFIAVAEDCGLIEPIGQWVLEQACARLAAWSGDPVLDGLALAVNVSARQFRSADFVERVLAALEVSGVAPARLKLEVTESLLLEDVNDAAARLDDLKAAGITVSLDDFGTGSSSLSYLSRLPLDQLKIDKSFVDELPADRQDAMIAQTIIAMGKGLGLQVVAEGVETLAQAQFLLGQGCDGFQGYRYGRPLPLKAFEAALRARAAGAATATATATATASDAGPGPVPQRRADR